MRLRAYLAEFLGTGLITATVVGSGIMAQTLTRDVLLQLFVNTFATVMALALAIFSRALIDPSTHVRGGSALFISEIVATAGLIATIFIASNQGRGEHAFWLVPLWIGSAYVFTSSTSFANPAITLGRSLTDSFSGIAIASVPLFIAAQFIGALLGHVIANLLVKPVQK